MNDRVKYIDFHVGEVEIVLASALLRRKENIRNKKDIDHKHGVIDDPWGNDIESTGAELAVAKCLGVYWDAPINNWKAADVIENIQVRHSKDHSNNCIVRKKDLSKYFYVLVTGRLPNYKIQGYVSGEDAKDDHYLRAPRGKEAAWFYPQTKLKCIDNLVVINRIALEIDSDSREKIKEINLSLIKKYNKFK